MSEDMSAQDARREPNPLLKIALELGPLALFFFANARWGIFAATAAFMVAVLVSLALSYGLMRRLPVMALVSAAVVAVFGGLTLVLQDETFIKLKPTIIYALFAGVLGVGVILDRPFLAIVFDSAFHLTAEGWRKLTLRWIAFFAVMAVLNEVVWRTQSTDFWVSFKLFGFMPLTFAFAMLQYRLLTRYAAAPPAGDAR
jgi:intracellular septation protein